MLQALTACAHRGCVAARDLGSEEMITRPVPGTLGSKLVRLMGSYRGGILEIRDAKVQRQFLSGSERVRRVSVVVSGFAIDVPRWSVGDIGVVGNSKQEVGKIISCVLAIKEKVSVVVRSRRPRVPGSDEVEHADIEAKLHGVLALGPGQVLIDLEVMGKLRIWPGVNNGVDVRPWVRRQSRENRREGKVPVARDSTPIVA